MVEKVIGGRQINRFLHIFRRVTGDEKQNRIMVFMILAVYCVLFSVSSCHADGWDDWGDSASSGPVVKRPFISGWWNWQYNEFSSFDQGRINFERELSKTQKLVAGANFNYYTEDNNKKWKVFPGENYYLTRAGDFDFKIGMLVENIGSGDKFSFVDKINSRRFHNGLANDYDRDKKEMPGLRANWYINKKFKLSGHFLPYFMASEFPTLFSKWAYAIHRSIAREVLFNGATFNAPKDETFDPQFHVELSATYPKIEMHFHYLRMKERFPVISQNKPDIYTGSYPLDETFAVNGSINVSKDYLMRYELAWTRDKSWTSFENGRIGKLFYSDHVGMLLGTDRNFPKEFYVNLQGMISYVPHLKRSTPFQLNRTEYLSSLQLRQNFRKDRLQFEFNALTNFTTGEYVLTPKTLIVQSDFLTFVLGFQVNGKGAESLGPVGQFSQNNTATFETRVTF